MKRLLPLWCLVIACGDAEPNTDVDAGRPDSGSAVDAGQPDGGAGATIEVRGDLTGESANGVPEGPLAGVMICVLQPTSGPCATTDAQGHYTLNVPSESDALLELRATDRAGYLVPLRTGSANGTLSLGMVTTQTVIDWGIAIGSPIDGIKGLVVLQVASDGVTASLDPSDGVRAYKEIGNSFDTAGATSSIVGFAMFFNAGLGDHTVSASHPTKTCARGALGWPAGNNSSARIPVSPGVITRLTIVCR